MIMKGKSKKKLGLIIFCLLIFILAIVVGVYLLLSVWKNDRIKDFQNQVDNFESLLTNFQGSGLDLTDYEQLLLESNNALAESKISDFDELEIRLKNDIKYLQKLIAGREELETLKTSCQEMFKKYRITESYQAAYEETLNGLDAAITAYNISEKNNLTQALEALEKGLLSDNQKEIQLKKNSINAIGTSKATTSELQMVSGYMVEVEEYETNKEYLEALDKLDVCLDLVTAIADRDTGDEPQVKDSETYVLEDSDKRKLTKGDVSTLSVYGFELAMCEIYARHGATFTDEQIQSYFDVKTWYTGTKAQEEIDTKKFNEFELANLTFLKECKEKAEADIVEESGEITVPDV